MFQHLGINLGTNLTTLRTFFHPKKSLTVFFRWFLLHCQGTTPFWHQESGASALAALLLVFRGFWALSWAIPLRGTVQLQLHPQHIECLGSTARDSSKIWGTAAGNETGVPSFSFLGGKVWKHDDVPIPDAFISWKLHFGATCTLHWPLCHGTLEEVKADLTRSADFRQEPFNPEIMFSIGKQVYSNKSPCALQTAMFSFGSRGAISSFCCQHSCIMGWWSLGTTWVCWALGKRCLAEMSDDGNACGSTSAIPKKMKASTQQKLFFGSVPAHRMLGTWAICMVSQFYDLYLVRVEWNAVSFLEYSEVCFPPSSSQVACDAE